MAEGAMKMEISLEKYKEMQDRIANLEVAMEIKSKQFNYALDLVAERDEKIYSLRAQQPHWISVKDRLPGHRAMYITCDELNIVEATMFDGNEDAVWNTVAGTKVTHWMPLPEPPEVEDVQG